jgi:hypothetical protein
MWFTRRQFSKLTSAAAFVASTRASPHSHNQRQRHPSLPALHRTNARAIEAQMTDDERFSLIISFLGPGSLVPRDPRFWWK